ncbi:MAG: amidase [Gemmatimonadota bacterium]
MSPADRRLDRRVFLKRMSALTAAASAGVAAGITPSSLGAAGVVGGRVAGGADVSDTRSIRRRPSRLGADSVARALPDPGAVQATEPAELTVAESAALIRAGRLDPVTLVRAYLDRIEAHDPALLAFNTVTVEAALAEAARLSREAWSGPLHGVPLAMKDNYYTAGVPTTANSLVFADFVPDFDATAWARLRDGGGVLLGKTQMGPLATTAASTPEGERTTFNAWAPGDRDVSPGGSSSGSATAVAARLVAGATGTQTGGSITNPSGAQGLTGLKPTMGRVSLHGIIPLTYTRDHPGPICRDALDAALLLRAMAGPDPEDPRTLGLPDVPDYVRAATPVERGDRPALRWETTVGVPPGYLDAPEDEPGGDEPRGPPGEASEARERRARRRRERQRAEVDARRVMLDRFRDLGARVVEIEYPAEWETLTSWNFNNVRLPERTEPFLEYLRRDVRLFGVSLSPWINGLLLPGAEYLRGQRAKLALLRTVLDDVFARCDVVLQTSPIPFDMVGLPLIAFPNGMVDGRPTGALLGGHPYAEDRLLSVAAAYQSVTGWHRERPADPEGGEGASRDGPDRGSRSPRSRERIDVWDVMRDGQ